MLDGHKVVRAGGLVQGIRLGVKRHDDVGRKNIGVRQRGGGKNRKQGGGHRRREAPEKGAQDGGVSHDSLVVFSSMRFVGN